MRLYDFFKPLKDTYLQVIYVNNEEACWNKTEQKIISLSTREEIKNCLIKYIKLYPGVDFNGDEGIICDIETA